MSKHMTIRAVIDVINSPDEANRISVIALVNSVDPTGRLLETIMEHLHD